MNRWRFFLCDVFFFGTARRTESHNPARTEGIEGIPIRIAIGMVNAVYSMGCIICLRRGIVLALGGHIAAGAETAEIRGGIDRARKAITSRRKVRPALQIKAIDFRL